MVDWTLGVNKLACILKDTMNGKPSADNVGPETAALYMPTEVRMVVTQDPFLPARFAAVAWDWSFTMNNLDLKALQCFIDARYGRGPEPAP